MQFSFSLAFGGQEGLLEGGFFFCSSVLKAQLDAACTSSSGWMNPWAGWSQLTRPRMSTTGNAQARLLREEGGKMAQQARCWQAVGPAAWCLHIPWTHC